MGLFDSWKEQREIRKLRARLELQALRSQVENAPRWLQATADARRFDIPPLDLPDRQAELYQRLSWVHAAVDAVANVCATVKLGVYRLEGEKRVEVDNHPFELLLQRPNPLNSRYELLYNAFAWRKLTGNAYLWLNRTSVNEPPREVWVLPSNQVKPVPDGRMYVKGYAYDPGNGQTIPLEPWEVLHWHGYHPGNPWVGMSAIESLATAAVGDMQASKWNTNFFAKDNAKLPGIVGFSDMVNDADWELIKRDWRENYGGAANKQLLLVRGLGEGAIHYIPTGVKQSEMQFLEGRNFSKEEIWTVLAPGLAAMLAVDANRSNSSNAYATFHALSVWPLLVALAEKFSNDLLPAYGPGLVAEYDDVRVVDRAMELRERQAYALVHTVDEVRAKYDDDDPLGDERGQMLVSELGARRASAVGGVVTGATEPEEEQAAGPAMRAADPLDVSDAEDAIKAELGAWYRWAVKRKPEKREGFTCEHVPPDVAAVIRERLLAAESEQEVKAAFVGPFLVKAERVSPSGKDQNADAKDRWERRILRLMRERLNGQMQDVLKLLGWPPNFDNLDDAFWDSATGQMIADLRPMIEAMATDASQTMIESTGVGVDWALVAQDASQWATRYTFDLVRGVTDTTRAALQRKLTAFVETPGMTREQLEDSLRPLFGDARASMIAVTETTRAYAEGERETARRAQEQGFRLVPRWHTANDELVCNVCGPNDGKLQTEGWTVDWPPAHVNCRCWVTHEWVE
jgi:HK97 family phage portal protein